MIPPIHTATDVEVTYCNTHKRTLNKDGTCGTGVFIRKAPFYPVRGFVINDVINVSDEYTFVNNQCRVFNDSIDVIDHGINWLRFDDLVVLADDLQIIRVVDLDDGTTLDDTDFTLIRTLDLDDSIGVVDGLSWLNFDDGVSLVDQIGFERFLNVNESIDMFDSFTQKTLMGDSIIMRDFFILLLQGDDQFSLSLNDDLSFSDSITSLDIHKEHSDDVVLEERTLTANRILNFVDLVRVNYNVGISSDTNKMNFEYVDVGDSDPAVYVTSTKNDQINIDEHLAFKLVDSLIVDDVTIIKLVENQHNDSVDFSDLDNKTVNKLYDDAVSVSEFLAFRLDDPIDITDEEPIDINKLVDLDDSIDVTLEIGYIGVYATENVLVTDSIAFKLDDPIDITDEEPIDINKLVDLDDSIDVTLEIGRIDVFDVYVTENVLVTDSLAFKLDDSIDITDATISPIWLVELDDQLNVTENINNYELQDHLIDDIQIDDRAALRFDDNIGVMDDPVSPTWLVDLDDSVDATDSINSLHINKPINDLIDLVDKDALRFDESIDVVETNKVERRSDLVDLLEVYDDAFTVEFVELACLDENGEWNDTSEFSNEFKWCVES